MACFLCNGGIELILGSISLIAVSVKSVFERRPNKLTKIK